jgi:predicted lipoprotein with Yx(FWY)xxD motif
MVSRRSFNLRLGGIATVLAAALFIAACGSSKSSSTSTASAAAAPATSSTAAPSTSPTTATTAAAGEAIGTAKGAHGTYLTADNGRALYLWVADTNGKSVCSGACAKAWPPVITKGKPVAGTGVSAADLATTMRSDDTEQVTYKGHPLYYFIADTGPGTTKGQGSNSFGAKWWLVTPSGAAITAGGSSGASAGRSSGASSGGSSGASSGGSSGGSSSSSGGGWG